MNVTFNPAGKEDEIKQENPLGTKDILAKVTAVTSEFDKNMDNISAENMKYLNMYHKCLFALVKVVTKRMKLFY